MAQDPYKWAKRRIGRLLDEFGPLSGERDPISPGGIWSVKKILVLDYYLAASHNIFKKNFKELYYVDTHCGSGMFKVKQADAHNDMLFPGSPLVAALRPDGKHCTKCLLSDSDGAAVAAPRARLSKLGMSAGGPACEAAVRDFAATSRMVKRMEQWNRAFVVNVDPAGFRELAWSDLERILSVDKADVFVTLMSYGIRLGRPHAQNAAHGMAATFDRVFGTGEWNACDNNDDLVDLYVRQIKSKKKYVEKLPVFATRGPEVYQLIFASNSQGGAGSIIDYTKKIADRVTTEMIAGAVGVAANKAQDLDGWIPGGGGA